jgi:hypothetical protein
MKFIIVLVFLTNTNPTTFAFIKEFKSMPSCKAAAEAIINEQEDKHREEARQRFGCIMMVDPKSIPKGGDA